MSFCSNLLVTELTQGTVPCATVCATEVFRDEYIQVPGYVGPWNGISGP